ncbi:hypothetical protein AAHA92_17587 [Salvia divinorum]|uniref:DUF7086 domain-containing protein n=1 Tax=Salvia divinorum TaxID=28513 RepID=A0ABD1GZA0_SALDI
MTIQNPNPNHSARPRRRRTSHLFRGSMEHLRANDIDTITGSVKCKRCDKKFQVECDLDAKFREVAEYVTMYHQDMCHRGPTVWDHPALLDCRFCGQHNCAKPVASKKERKINWLFLFLGQMVGCCKLLELSPHGTFY